MCFETRTVNRAPSSEGNVKHIASRMYGPRSGTMVPDKVPRKVMGGGFRAHSPPRHSLAATGKGISPRNNSLGIRNSADVFDSATPRSGHGGKRKTPNSKDQLILMQEQEAADIEREYIKNLQQQVCSHKARLLKASNTIDVACCFKPRSRSRTCMHTRAHVHSRQGFRSPAMFSLTISRSRCITWN
jgi:hypothetical protein